MATKYLLDTNILAFHQRGRFDIKKYLTENGIERENCYISEITEIELLVGEKILEKNGIKAHIPTQSLINCFRIIPISNAKEMFVREKCRLRFTGTPAEDNFDLLIGCTAVANNMVMVTNNIKDFKNIKNINIENWIENS